MPGHKFPHHRLEPGEEVIYSYGLRANGTYSESAMIMTPKKVYVDGSYFIKEGGKKGTVEKGLLILDNQQVFDIKEKTHRNRLILIFVICLLSALVYINLAAEKYPIITVGSVLDYELILTLITAGLILFYITFTRRFIVIQYHGGELRLRNRGMRINSRETVKIFSPYIRKAFR